MIKKGILTTLIFMLGFSLLLSAKIVYVEYFPNGNVKIEVIKLKKGIHQINQYYACGTLMETGFSKNGKSQGRWLHYSPEGDVTASAYFHDNVKIGSWNYFNQWSNRSYQVRYDQGRAISYKEFDHSGTLIASGTSTP